jgi:hypothetical protein
MQWQPSFFRESPLFWPIAPAAARLEAFAEWPQPEELACLFAGEPEPPVRFAAPAPKPRRARATADARYDARITQEGVVPTRPRSWHDLLNALVWASFPRAKRALHARQHRMIAARLGADLRLPGARTKEQDAVAMLDEGGVAVLRAGGDASVVVFGHAIFEGLVADRAARVRAAAYAVDVGAIHDHPAARVAAVDEALAALLSREAPIGHGDFGSVIVDGAAV